MKSYYQTQGWMKFYEEDTYKDGCIGTGSSNSGNEVFTANTIGGLLDKLRCFTNCVSNRDILLDSCEEIGRVDIQTMEDDNGNTITPHQYAQWKQNKCRLWACTYTFHVELIHSEAVNLNNAVILT